MPDYILNHIHVYSVMFTSERNAHSQYEWRAHDTCAAVLLLQMALHTKEVHLCIIFAHAYHMLSDMFELMICARKCSQRGSRRLTGFDVNVNFDFVVNSFRRVEYHVS